MLRSSNIVNFTACITNCVIYKQLTYSNIHLKLCIVVVCAVNSPHPLYDTAILTHAHTSSV